MRVGFVMIAAALAACSNEAREIGPTPPQTRPAGNADPRTRLYQDNAYQLSQGGRYFAWYGCAGCHDASAGGATSLAGRSARATGFAQVFARIADGHGRLGYGARIPIEQLWQITAYVRDLPRHTPEKRRRLSLDQRAEPVGSRWSGPQ